MMIDKIARIRTLTGITPTQLDDDALSDLLEIHDGRIYCAAADAADRMGTSMITGAGVTAVEDISVDRTRVIDAWNALADRLRDRCADEEEEAWDPGPVVVEFRPYGYGWSAEAVEGHA